MFVTFLVAEKTILILYQGSRGVPLFSGGGGGRGGFQLFPGGGGGGGGEGSKC